MEWLFKVLETKTKLRKELFKKILDFQPPRSSFIKHYHYKAYLNNKEKEDDDSKRLKFYKTVDHRLVLKLAQVEK